MLERKLEFVYVKSNSENTKRLTTVLAGYPFYESSGHNSFHEKTWFPYQGFQPFDIGGLSNKGTFLKPETNLLDKDRLSNFFSEPLLSYLNESVKNNKNLIDWIDLIARFGNQEAMFLSMLIGGGVWNTTEGKNLENLISTEYRDTLEQLNNFYKDDLSTIKLIHEKESNHSVLIPTEDNTQVKKLNTWLKNNGSKHQNTEIEWNNETYENPSINFKCPESFSIQHIPSTPFPYKTKNDIVLEAISDYSGHRQEHLSFYQSKQTGENRAQLFKNLLIREGNDIYKDIIIYAIFAGKSGPHLQEKVYRALGFDDLKSAKEEYRLKIEKFKEILEKEYPIMEGFVDKIIKQIRKSANDNKGIDHPPLKDKIEILDTITQIAKPGYSYKKS